MGSSHHEEPRVLVLTAPVDPTADVVIQHLAAAGVPFARFDSAQFPTEISLTATLDADDGWRARLGGVSLAELHSVYYRRPRRFAFDPAIPTEQLNWCEGQARYGFWGVLETLAVTWINPPSAVQRAEYKPRQLRLARQAGLSVPPTMITSCPRDVTAFASAVGGRSSPRRCMRVHHVTPMDTPPASSIRQRSFLTSTPILELRPLRICSNARSQVPTTCG